jgi:hypothetical protein
VGVRDKLLTKTRESSGSTSSNRFDFQKDWALCHLLELHEGARDYILVFEHHEDIVVLFCGSATETAECYQIKTKEPGRWTLTNLLSRKKLKAGEGLSILGKMYENIKVFGDGATTVNLVSNALYSMTLGDGSTCDSKDCICIGDIDPTDLTKIRTQLRAEHSLAADPTFGAEGHLRVTTLSLHDHATHAVGKLEAFLSRTRPGRVYSVSTLYRTLFDEVRRRSNYEWDSTNLDAILKNKALSRAQFQKLLDNLPEAKTFDTFWTQASTQLTSEGMPFPGILSLKKACQSHEVARMDPGNDLEKQMAAAAKAEYAAVAPDPSIGTLRAIMDATAERVFQRKIPGCGVYDRTSIRAMVLMAIYEY